MQNIIIGRYDRPCKAGWFGWAEPADKSWIVFIPLDGAPVVFANRDPDTGAVVD